MLATAALLALATTAAAAPRAWKEVSVEDYGAKGDNLVACAASMSHPGAGGQCCDTAIGAPTDNTKAFRAALAAVKGGGQVTRSAHGSMRVLFISCLPPPST